jgi:hypothetical protein
MHLRRKLNLRTPHVDTAPNPATAAEAAMVLGLALSRAQRFAEAVKVLDRADYGPLERSVRYRAMPTR